MVKKSNETVEDIMKKQLSLLENSDKLSKLEKESVRDKKIIQELKEREKVSARALVLFERKIKYLKETAVSEVLKLCKMTDESNVGENVFELLKETNEKLYGLCNLIEQQSKLSESDKAFILNKQIEDKKEDAQTRFERLKANFDQKIGESVLRKPGRPKKQDQSIVADIGLGKKVEKVVDEKVETKNRLNDIFYGTPQTKTAVSTIPQTEDSLFDFSEALNPNGSLKDIMADIIGDMSKDEKVVYNKDNIDKFLSKIDKTEAKELELGIIKKPHLHNFEEIKEEKKDNRLRKTGILMNNNLFDDIKK